MARTQDVWGAEGISGRVKFLPLAWAGMPKTSFRKNSDSPIVFFVFIAGNIQAKEDTPPQKILNLAEQGDAKAQFDLGVMYDTGKGAPQDYKQAFYWYTKAAEQGNLYAQSNLGVMYDTGKGVSQDYTKAFAWLSLASAQGIINAKNNLDFVRKKLNQSELVEAQELSNKYYKLYVEPFQ